MAITGHTKESTFLSYIRATSTENAQRFKDLYLANKSKEVLKVIMMARLEEILIIE